MNGRHTNCRSPWLKPPDGLTITSATSITPQRPWDAKGISPSLPAAHDKHGFSKERKMYKQKRQLKTSPRASLSVWDLLTCFESNLHQKPAFAHVSHLVIIIPFSGKWAPSHYSQEKWKKMNEMKMHFPRSRVPTVFQNWNSRLLWDFSISYLCMPDRPSNSYKCFRKKCSVYTYISCNHMRQ